MCVTKKKFLNKTKKLYNILYTIKKKRIIGLYSTFIILIAQFVRDLFLGSPANIMFSELPNVDRILQLLDDILLVRSFKKFDLEYELYEKIVYIYRDPSYLIEITKDQKEPTGLDHDTNKTNNESPQKQQHRSILKKRI